MDGSVLVNLICKIAILLNFVSSFFDMTNESFLLSVFTDAVQQMSRLFLFSFCVCVKGLPVIFAEAQNLSIAPQRIQIMKINGVIFGIVGEEPLHSPLLDIDGAVDVEDSNLPRSDILTGRDIELITVVVGGLRFLL